MPCRYADPASRTAPRSPLPWRNYRRWKECEMATTTEWVAGARLRTLPLAVAPVIVGTGAAIGLSAGFGSAPWREFAVCNTADCGIWGWNSALRAILALIVSLAL